MDRVPGRDDFAEASEAERSAVMDDYMGILARLHRLDVEPFARAGVLRVARPQDSGRIGIETYERAYRSAKKRPDPFLEFCLGWLARNPLANPGRESVVLWDTGQFHHQGGRIVALLDLEIGHIGDPLMDLAGLRMRDSVIGYGDLARLYRRYVELGGQPIDLDAIRHHHFAFALTNQLAFHAALAEPPPGSDFMMNMRWCAETNLYAIEALAELLDVRLAELESPDPRASRAAVGHAHLVRWLRDFDAGDPVRQQEVRSAFRLARHLARVDEIDGRLEAADLDDLGALLGRRPASWQEGDARL